MASDLWWLTLYYHIFSGYEDCRLEDGYGVKHTDDNQVQWSRYALTASVIRFYIDILLRSITEALW